MTVIMCRDDDIKNPIGFPHTECAKSLGRKGVGFFMNLTWNLLGLMKLLIYCIKSPQSISWICSCN